MLDTRPFSPGVIVETIPVLLPFLLVTLAVGLASIILGSLFGGLLAWAKLSHNKIAFSLAEGYTYIIRCTPAIVLLFVVFYGLPKLVEEAFGYDINDMSRAVFAVITFTLLFGGYVSEVFRGAYLAVDKGQYEAAVSIGLSPQQAFTYITLPQTAVIALPNFGNSVINLLKESALAYTIGLIDLLGKADLIIARNFGAWGIEIYLAAMIIYWIMNIVIEKSFLKLEAYLSRQRQVRAS